MKNRRLPALSMLRAFEAAARHQNFGAAADELGVSHSAISHQIRGLETWFDLSLFERSARKVSLTSAGAALAGETSRAFDILATAVDHVHPPDPDRPVLLSVEPAFAARWLVLRLDRFYAKHGDVRLHLVATPDFAEFEPDGVDLAIRYGRGDWPDLTSEKILNSAAFPVLSPRLLADSPPLKAPVDLKNFQLIHEEDTSDWKAWLETAGAETVDANRGPIFDDAHLTLEAATSGQGVALADEALAAAALADGRLVRPFSHTLEIATGYFVVHPNGTSLRRNTEAFRSWLIEETRAEREGT
jgi:LysR family transcriptional regulator, glycine cleavage system transcriptional activator